MMTDEERLSAAFSENMLDALSEAMKASGNDPKSDSFENLQCLVRAALSKTLDECYVTDKARENIQKHLVDCEARAQKRMLDRASAAAGPEAAPAKNKRAL